MISKKRASGWYTGMPARSTIFTPNNFPATANRPSSTRGNGK
jgi:hypothetical protein